MGEHMTPTRLAEIRERHAAAVREYGEDTVSAAKARVLLFGEEIVALLDAVEAQQAEIRRLVTIIKDSFCRLPLTPNRALGWDGQNLVPHVEAVAAEYGPLRPLAEELARARAKHFSQTRMLAALMEEVGETAQAYLEGQPEHARQEALQVACVAMRIFLDGDWDFEPPKAMDGMDGMDEREKHRKARR